MRTVTVTRPPAPGVRAEVIEAIEHFMPVFAAGMHVADDLTLAHEAQRLEGLPTSPVVSRMRQIVGAELRERRAEGGATRG